MQPSYTGQTSCAQQVQCAGLRGRYPSFKFFGLKRQCLRHMPGKITEGIQVALDSKQPQIQSIIPKDFLLINRTDWERGGGKGAQTISICIDSFCTHCFANSPAFHYASFLCLVTVKNCPIKSVFQNQAFKSRRMHVHPFTHLPV